MHGVDPNEALGLANNSLEPQPVPLRVTQGHLAVRPFVLLEDSPVVVKGVPLVDVFIEPAQHVFPCHSE